MKELKVIYEDNHCIVVIKPAGIPSQADKTGDIDIDYIISPVRDAEGRFFDSRHCDKFGYEFDMPINADANGAYNIARKALYAIDIIKATDDSDLNKAMIYPKNSEWLEYVQK